VVIIQILELRYATSLILRNMKKIIQNILARAGMKLVRYPESDEKRRVQLVDFFRINKILDVGANAGQYALQMRRLGFKGRIISYEPLNQAFSTLSRIAASDPNWETWNLALGDENTESEINIAANSFSSSFLDILPAHTRSAPQSAYVKKQKVQIKTLDSIFEDIYQPDDRVLLKIDTQGFEKKVIDGAQQSLPQIKGIQLEMSIIPLYMDEMLFTEMISYLKERGFDLFSLENGFANPMTGQLLQVDGIFFRQPPQDQ
jgi:FkbM family methyltransferase